MSQNGFFFECNTHSRDGLSKPAPNSQLNLLPLYWVYVGISVLFFGDPLTYIGLVDNYQ